MTVEQLKAEVAKAQAEAQKQVSETMERVKLESQLKLATDPSFIRLKAQAQMQQSTTNKLTEIDRVCEEIVSSMPVYNSKTRENRKWRPTRVYGLGKQIELLSGILAGIQYSTLEHKQQMLTYVGISEDLIEQTLEAFGQPSYYSNNYNIVVEEKPCDIDSLNQCLTLLEDALDITIDRKPTEAVMRQRFEVARVRAERMALEDQMTDATTSGQTIQID